MTKAEALTQALVLALCAPDDEKSQKALKLAEHFAQGLEAAEVEECKADALAVVKAWGTA